MCWSQKKKKKKDEQEENTNEPTIQWHDYYFLLLLLSLARSYDHFLVETQTLMFLNITVSFRIKKLIFI